MEGPTTAGPVEVDRGKNAVGQLWDVVMGSIHVLNHLEKLRKVLLGFEISHLK
jgi:hypothetical protein